MALVQKRVDDISGTDGAEVRWAAISDGKKVYLIQIDLVDRNFGTMESAFKNAMSRYSVVGEASTVKMDDLATVLPGIKMVEGTPIPAGAPLTYNGNYVAHTPEVESVPAETEVPVAKASAPKKAARKKYAPQPGKPVADGLADRTQGNWYLAKTKRPGVRHWWVRNAEILQLPPARHGRLPRVVEEAFDRYQGKDVTEENMHPDDLARLTEPAKPVPTPKELFSNHGG